MKVKVNGAWVDVPAFKVETGVPLEDVKTMLSSSATSIVIPEGITELGWYVFNRQNYESTSPDFAITFPTTLVKIGANCFEYAKLGGRLYLPPNIATIMQYAFTRTNIEEVVWDAVAQPTNTYLFSYCSNLKKVVFNIHIQTVGNTMFYNDTALEEVDFSHCTSVPRLPYTTIFTNVPNSCTIKVPSALYSAWTTATNWATLVAQGYNFVAV